MMTAKIFENGGSQAVRLPKECRFSSNEVIINRIGNVVVLAPKTGKWDMLIQAIDMFSADFMENGREPQEVQKRDSL